ncbi:MAG: crotonase/enoyl-CoA hydratase family protein [Ilumatobacteraceae bacterium]|nr:crotonase/enoyl-CoA hydratase family protein [Ilumatobacteraceae bacterium]
MVTNDSVTYALIDGVGVITMDDGKANAISLAMQKGLNAALDQAEKDTATVVLAGRPGILSAGFDLKTLNAGGADAVAMLNGGIEIAIRLLSFPTPVVIACGGHAIAMGVFLLLSGDYRIGVKGNFRYTANEVAIGMTMPYSTIEIMRNRLTPSAINRSVMLAEVFTPDNAVETGFLDLVVDDADLMTSAMAFAQSTSGLNVAAHLASKKRVRGQVLEAIRAGLVIDSAGWQKQFVSAQV